MDRFGDDFQTVSEILGTKTPDMVKGIIAFHSKIYYNKSKTQAFMFDTRI